MGEHRRRVSRGRAGAPAQRRAADRGGVALRDAPAADHASGAHDAVGLLVGGQVPDGLHDDVAAQAVREVEDPLHALGAALGDDVGRAPLAPQVGPGLVTAHEDDALGAHLACGEHGGQPDRAVADDRHGLARGHARHVRGVVPREVHVREREQ